MSVDTKTYLDAIGSFATGVTVVTAETDGNLHGMTATAVTSLSLSPMLLAVMVAKKAKMAEILKPGARFTVNILRADHASLSNHFAGAIKTSERAPVVRLVPWESGARLDDSLAALGCEVAEVFEGGDHWIVVGRVHHLHQGSEPREPLLYFRGRYGRLEPGGALAPARDDLEAGTPQIYYEW